VDQVRLVYVAGPYRAATEYAVACNVHRAAAEAAELLYAHGYAVVCPHSMSHGWERHQCYTNDRTLEHCCEIVRRCDAVLVVGAWLTSSGTLQEIEAALAAGVQVYYSRQDLLSALPVS
jgi:nucleoside 2-deoxyribosyltransferase